MDWRQLVWFYAQQWISDLHYYWQRLLLLWWSEGGIMLPVLSRDVSASLLVSGYNFRLPLIVIWGLQWHMFVHISYPSWDNTWVPSFNKTTPVYTWHVPVGKWGNNIYAVVWHRSTLNLFLYQGLNGRHTRWHGTSRVPLLPTLLSIWSSILKTMIQSSDLLVLTVSFNLDQLHLCASLFFVSGCNNSKTGFNAWACVNRHNRHRASTYLKSVMFNTDCEGRITKLLYKITRSPVKIKK